MSGTGRDLTIARGTGSYIAYELFRCSAGGEGRSDDAEDEQVDDEDNEGTSDGGDGCAA